MNTSNFELDLLDFQGRSLELDFEATPGSAAWLLENSDAALKVDEDESFYAELDAQLSGTTIHIQGHIEGSFFYRCGRCLEWRPMSLDEPVRFVLMSRQAWEDKYSEEDEVVLQEEELDVSYYEEEIIDLRPLLREAVLLELPTFPVCPDELSDACDTAYERVVGEETLEENEENSIDLRWSKLKDIELDGDDA